MSDTAQAQGWWQATDGKWYPPELHPNAAPRLAPPVAPTPPAQSYTQFVQPTATAAPKRRKKPWWRRWWAIALALIIAVIVIANVAAPSEDDTTSTGTTPEAADVGNVAGGVADSVADQATEPPADNPQGSRENPVPVGQPTTFTMDTFGDADNSQWTMTVDGPGSDITQAVLAENQFNEQPQPGKFFYGVPVTLTLNSAEKEPLSIFVNFTPEFFGPSSLSIISDGFSEGCGVTPNEFDVLKEVFAGGSISGTVCYQVSNEDAAGGVLLTFDDVEGDRQFMATR